MNEINDIPNEWKNTSDLFIALGDSHRQRILLLIKDNGRMNILQILEHSNLSRTAVTHHLKVLKNSGALQSEKVGKEVFFWVNKQRIVESLSAVLDFLKD